MITKIKKLSRNRKRRIERKSTIDNIMKLLLNEIKSEKKKKKLNKVKQLELLLVNIKYANDPKNLENALKELNKIHVVKKKLHEIKHEILLDYERQFEMVGNFKIGDQIGETPIRFRNIND